MLDKDKILSDAKEWFTESFAKSHIWTFGLRRASSSNPLVVYRQIANRLKHLETTHSL